ncbi:MAG: flagellar motor switch protein FliN [Spirochaetales bacterium]|jgi:flagellar motor switch protein FliN|nr:flagellar motor switch protein FliN [Spirochaetales bacterium]
MSDGSLSQDEIDALLQGSGGFDVDTPSAAPAPAAAAPTGIDTAAFEEFLTGHTPSQAANLTNMIGKDVTIGAPQIEIISNGTFVSSLPPEVVQIILNFSGGAAGSHSYLFTSEIATTIAGLMMGQEEIELNEAALSALEEAGNTMAGSVATAMSEQLSLDISTEPAQSRTIAANNVEAPDGEFVKVTYPVTIEGQDESQLMELFDMSIASLVGAPAAAAAPADAAPAGGLFDGGGLGDDSLFGGAMDQSPLDMGFGGQGAPNVQAVQFPALGNSVPGSDQGNIGLLMDVYMEMTVELGRTKKLIRDILGMGEGTIIELDKLAGEPVDILVNHKLIAKGEVVVIDENFGVRVTEIVDPMDRVSDM